MATASAYYCPVCRQPLPESSARAGQIVQCPACQGVFRLGIAPAAPAASGTPAAVGGASAAHPPSVGTGIPVGIAAPPVHPPAPPGNFWPPGAVQPVSAAASPMMPPAMPPVNPPGLPAGVPPHVSSQPPVIAASGMPPLAPPVTSAGNVSSSRAIPVVGGPPVRPPAVAAGAGNVTEARPINTARVIIGNEAPSTVTLTPEGKLPELHLVEGDAASAKGRKSGGNSLLLGGVLTLSVLSTLGLLFFDPSPTPVAGNSAAEARRELARYYQVNAAAPKPYQSLLRDGVTAHARGDYKLEREKYQSVLKMIRMEGRDPFHALTGTPSDDEKLERLLTTLLSADGK